MIEKFSSWYFSTDCTSTGGIIMAQLTTIDVKAFRLNTAIQRFNQLSLQNLAWWVFIVNSATSHLFVNWSTEKTGKEVSTLKTDPTY